MEETTTTSATDLLVERLCAPAGASSDSGARDDTRDAPRPPAGAGGELFVDAARRLWYRKGGTTWLRVA